MKNSYFKLIPLSCALISIFSCATTSNQPNNDQNQDQIIEIDEDVVQERTDEKRAGKPLSVKTKTNQQETEFIQKLKDIDLKLISSPKVIFETQNFKTPYTVLVESSQGPVPDFDVTVSFPSSKTQDSIIYDTVQLKSDIEGKVTFKPATATFAANDKVTFYPSPVNSTQEMINAAYNLAVTAPYQVKSQNLWYQGILYVYDFNERGNPTTNSTLLLRTLRNAGVNVGNAPISSTSYYDKPISQLYKDNYAIVGNSCRFMVVGSIKYSEPVQEVQNRFTTTLTADITCLEMKTGKQLCNFQITEKYTDSNRYNSAESCKAALIQKVADGIMYGM